MAKGYQAGSAYVSILPRLTGFQPALRAELKKLKQVNHQVKITPRFDLNSARRELNKFEAEVSSKLSNLNATVKLDADITPALAQLQRLNGQTIRVQVELLLNRQQILIIQQQVRASSATMQVDLDGSRVRGAIGGLAKLSALAFASLGTQAAAGGLVAVAGAAAAAGASLAVLPAVLGAAGLAVGAVQLGLVGMSDAMKAIGSGDAEALTAAMENMAPAGREFVTAIRDLKPAFDELRVGVQQEMFTGMGDALRVLAENYLPVASAGFAGLAGELRQTVLQMVGVANSQQSISDLGLIFDNTTTMVDRMNPVLGHLLAAFRDITAVGSDFLPGFGSTIASYTEQFAGFIARVRETGELKTFIEGGIAALQLLGGVLFNVGAIIFEVFSAGSALGGGFLETIRQVTSEVLVFLRSAEGQTMLQTFFTAVGAAVTALMPLVSTLAQIFFGTLYPALANLATQLAPIANVLLVALLDAFRQIMPVVPIIGATIIALVQAFLPLVPILANLVTTLLPPFLSLIQLIAPALPALAAAVLTVIAAMKGLSIINTVIQMWKLLQLAFALSPFGVIMVAIGALVAGLITAYNTSETFRNIVQAVFAAVGQAAQWMWNNVLLPVFGWIKAGWDGLMTGISWAWTNILQPAWGALQAYIQFMWNNVLRPYFGFIGAAWSALMTGLVWAWQNVLQPAWNALVATAQWVWDRASAIFSGMRTAVVAIFTGIRDLVSGVWNGLKDTVVNGAQNIWTWVTDKFNGMKDAVVSIFTGIRDTVGAVWDGIQEKVKAPIRVVFNFVNDRMIGPVNSILDKFPGNLRIPNLPRLATGGLLRGPGTGTSDSILALDPHTNMPTAFVSNGEYVVKKKVVDQLGVSYLDAMNAGQVPGHAIGGLVGGKGWSRDVGGPLDLLDDAWDATGGRVVSGVANAAGALKNFATDMLAKGARKAAELILRPIRDAAMALIPNKVPLNMLSGGIDRMYNAVLGKGDEKDRELQAASQAMGPNVAVPPGGVAAGRGVAGLFATVKRAFPEARLNSGYRPGDPGYHGSGQAVDLGWMRAPGGNGNAYMAAMNQWIYDNFPASRELIYNGLGDNRPNKKNGRDFPYSAGTQAQHKNHVHWVYDNGGWLMPGATQVFNGTGKPEAVFTAEQFASIDRLVESAGGAPRTVIHDQRRVYAEVDARRLASEMANQQREMEYLHG